MTLSEARAKFEPPNRPLADILVTGAEWVHEEELESMGDLIAALEAELREAQSALCSAHGERLWPGETLAEQITACIQERTRTIDDLESELAYARESNRLERDNWRKWMLEIKGEVGPCSCHEAYTVRGRMDPDCTYHRGFPLGEDTYKEKP